MQRPSFGQEPAAVAQEVLLLLARVAEGAHAQPVAMPRAFQCKTCSRRFTSFQALGGHRASHKRPRGNAALAPAPAQARRRRRHGCAMCGLEFALGQALGGHMRRHRAGAGAEEDETSARGAADEEREQQQQRGGEISETTRPGMLLGLDLNAAPPSDGAGTPQLLRLWV